MNEPTGATTATREPVFGLADLAAQADLAVETVRRYAEAGLLAPARRGVGDTWVYGPRDLADVRFLAGVERLDLGAAAPGELAERRLAGDCARVQHRMGELVAARLAHLRPRLADALAAQAAAGGLHSADAAPLTHSLALHQQVALLQDAAGALAGPPRTGPCDAGCPCSAAAAATGTTYHFPTADGATAAGPPIVCTLAAVGDHSDMVARLEQWQALLAAATGREAVDDGIAVTFDHDIARATELGRLLAAEYACCSFARYAMIIDERGIRIEIRTPPEGRDALAAVFGLA